MLGRWIGSMILITQVSFFGGSVIIPSKDSSRRELLSNYYWETWADKRPPICVICPNGDSWIIDAKADFGPGWRVTGTGPNITCSPAIVLPGYHGTLQDGVFSPDLEGRGIYGALSHAQNAQTVG